MSIDRSREMAYLGPAMQRMTRQRRAIVDALERAGRPLSPQELEAEASKEVEGLNLATVYRNIKTLVESGYLETVELVGQPARYELAGLDHHHHFLCEVCDRLFDLPGCLGAFKSLVPRGFSINRHELQLIGECATCRTAARN